MKTSAERWLPVPGYQGRYLISDQGNIKKVLPNNSTESVKGRTDRAGYVTVRLYLNDKSYTCFIHRLVATSFINNAQNKPLVNHKNGIKSDNRAENLEWVTHSENIQHAYDSGLISLESKRRIVIDICSGRQFESVKEAACYYQIPYSTCKNYLNGNRTNNTCLRYEDSLAA